LTPLNCGDDLPSDHVLSGPGPQHQLEEDPLLELLDRVHDCPAFVPANGPGREDPPGREHVDPQRDLADPALPYGFALLVLLIVQTHWSASHTSPVESGGGSSREKDGRKEEGPTSPSRS
jgi:hypothetical protein